MTDSPWYELVEQFVETSSNAEVEWHRDIPEPEPLTEEVIQAEYPQWTSPPDLWRPKSTLGEISADPSVE